MAPKAKRAQIQIDGITIDIERKNIKSIRLSVYPDGRVRLAVPLGLGRDVIASVISSKLEWIRQQRVRFNDRECKIPPAMVTGERHYFLGKLYQLSVIEQKGPRKIVIHNDSVIQLLVRPGDTREKRLELLLQWYRQQLKTRIPPLIAKWEPILGVQVADWGIKRMKTRWGTCNITARRIWLNLELAKRPEKCLEYIVVHEMLHIIERYHNTHFTELLDEYLPHWRDSRSELNGLRKF